MAGWEEVCTDCGKPWKSTASPCERHYCVGITDTFISPIAPLLTNISDASRRVPQQFPYGASEFAKCLAHHLRPSAPSPNRAHPEEAGPGVAQRNPMVLRRSSKVIDVAMCASKRSPHPVFRIRTRKSEKPMFMSRDSFLTLPQSRQLTPNSLNTVRRQGS